MIAVGLSKAGAHGALVGEYSISDDLARRIVDSAYEFGEVGVSSAGVYVAYAESKGFEVGPWIAPLTRRQRMGRELARIEAYAGVPGAVPVLAALAELRDLA